MVGDIGGWEIGVGMREFGPETRSRLEESAADFFHRVVGVGFVRMDDGAIAEGGPDHDSAQLLLGLGLLAREEETQSLVPVDPATVASRVVVPLGRQGAELVAESSRWADAFADLGQTYRRARSSRESGVSEVRGFENIDRFLTAALLDCQEELLTAQPFGRRSPEILATAAERDVRALRRGVRMRTLYQHPARRSQPTRDYVAQVTAKGGEVRTLDEFFNRLIVIDRELAVIPAAAETDQIAVAIHARPLVDYLVDIFERAWERARPFTQVDAEATRTVASDVRAMTLRMLIEGHSDPASAKRMGVSPRTYASYVATLKAEYRSDTRFQLGYELGRGASGRPETIEDDLPATALAPPARREPGEVDDEP